MNHNDHVELLRGGVPGPGGNWADLGAGSGAFTLALVELIGPAGQITAIDKDRRALARLEAEVVARYPGTQLTVQVADFTRPLELPPFDGVVMANALHFVPRADQETTLRTVLAALRPGGRMILVEYGTDRGNCWVPYALAYKTFEKLAAKAGFTRTSLLKTRPSRFLGQIYSACTVAKGVGPEDGVEIKP